jgi:GNAT superfamily N-acetyltransferase
LAPANDLLIRPLRQADKERVLEICRDVWDGHDYLPNVFDDWIIETGAAFQAAEVDGVVVGVQRLRPYAEGLIWYEALRVASSHRRQGLARAMLESATAEARQQGFREMRLATGNIHAVALFESAGFRRLLDMRWWKASRLEGGEAARVPDAKEAERLVAGVASSPGFALYSNVIADFNGAADLNSAEVANLAEKGWVRAGPGGRAMALLREPWGDNIAVSVIAGSGGSLRELLTALRFEADADDVEDVTISVPRDHPAADDLEASGYHFANAEDHSYIYGLLL